MRNFKCKDCHFFKENEPFKILSDGKYYPCSNIGVDGWEHWIKEQEEPEHCEAFCKAGEYVPTGIFADIATLVRKVADEIDKDFDVADYKF